jgi:hypothetical protein
MTVMNAGILCTHRKHVLVVRGRQLAACEGPAARRRDIEAIDGDDIGLQQAGAILQRSGCRKPELVGVEAHDPVGVGPSGELQLARSTLFG